jgi:8-oxoguanine deaminase
VGPDVWYAHMVHLDDNELRLCASTGTGIAHCPQSNARLGSGIARIPEAMALGVPVSLAVDGAASNEAADMASEVHCAWLTHRSDPRAGTRPLAGGTQSGGHAAAMTVEDVVLAVYTLDQPRHFGLHDAAIGPVASGGRTSLRAVLVQGRVVVENDAIPGLDMAQLQADAQAFVNTLLAHA